MSTVMLVAMGVAGLGAATLLAADLRRLSALHRARLSRLGESVADQPWTASFLVGRSRALERATVVEDHRREAARHVEVAEHHAAEAERHTALANELEEQERSRHRRTATSYPASRRNLGHAV